MRISRAFFEIFKYVYKNLAYGELSLLNRMHEFEKKKFFFENLAIN